jgi:hypothetical protein
MFDDGLSEEERKLYRRRKERAAWIGAMTLMALLSWALNAWGLFWLLVIICGTIWLLVGQLPRDRPFCRQNSMINQRVG